jgi:hypothetical protein
LSLVQFGVVAAVVLTGSTAAQVFGSWLAARAADGASRWCWTMFGTAVTVWTAADVAWFANGLGLDVVGMIPTANALYLAGLGPIVAGLLFYPVGNWERGAGLRLVLDVLVLSSALMLVTHCSSWVRSPTASGPPGRGWCWSTRSPTWWWLGSPPCSSCAAWGDRRGTFC